jgi:hypothetical protein
VEPQQSPWASAHQHRPSTEPTGNKKGRLAAAGQIAMHCFNNALNIAEIAEKVNAISATR